MPHFLRAGGYVTWVIIILGLVLLASAVQFARKPTPRGLAFLRAMSVAYLLSVIGGVATCFMTVFYNIVRQHERTGEWNLDGLLWGFGEALTPAGMGFTVLGSIWVIIAIGVRRGHESEA
jgi:hypothetical protein